MDTKLSSKDKSGASSSVDSSWMIADTEVWILVGSESPTCETMFLRAAIKYLDSKRNVVGLYRKEDPSAISDEVDCSKVFQRNLLPIEQGVQDMVTLDNLNEAEILYNLRKRYDKNAIYTYIGPTLIAINPYKRIDSIDSPGTLQLYQTTLIKNGFIDPKTLPPHTFAIAAQAYSQLFENMRNQALVISGESGAGKTENTKLAMTFLTSLSAHDPHQPQAARRLSMYCESIEDRILKCNPILEAFGNAKTVRNDNSSRFGKYVRLLVDPKSRRIQGAEISNYLLEKSRVTIQGAGERGYHIFYELLKGSTNQQLKQLRLTSESAKDQVLTASSFTYLNSGNCIEVSTLDDKELFVEVTESLDSLGFSIDEKQTIWQILSAILLLGNLKYDSSTLTDESPCRITTIQTATDIASLLQIQFTQLQSCLLMKKRTVGAHVMQSPLSMDDIQSNQDSLARTLYDQLFSWLVKKLNLTIHGGNHSQNNESAGKLSIGLLDIFGFEVFKINSFEQLCINYTNEKLQQLYISYVFKSEEQELAAQGLADRIAELQYSDNQLVIDLLDKYPKGIFDLLDESSSLGSSTDASLFQKICQTHKAGTIFVLNKSSVDTFSIRHTAQIVEYNINGFRNKNKAEVSTDITECIMSSNNQLVGDIFLGLVGEEVKQREIIMNTPKKPSKNDKFLGAKFRFQMKQLMDELMASNCHFIRCIKPNEQKKSDLFIAGYAFIQIKYLGVLEAIRVRKEGFPYRKNFEDFYREYGELLKKFRGVSAQQATALGKVDLKTICLEICAEVLSHKDRLNVLIGTTKLFAKDSAGKALHELLMNWAVKKAEWARIIQRNYRRYVFAKQIGQKLKSIGRAVMAFRRIAATFKMKKQRKKYLKKRSVLKSVATHAITKMKEIYMQRWRQKCFKIKALTLIMKKLSTMVQSRKKEAFKKIKSVGGKKKEDQSQKSKPVKVIDVEQQQQKQFQSKEKEQEVIPNYPSQKQEMNLEIELTEVVDVEEERPNEWQRANKSDDDEDDNNRNGSVKSQTKQSAMIREKHQSGFTDQSSVFIEENNSQSDEYSMANTSMREEEDITDLLRGKSLALRMTRQQKEDIDDVKAVSIIGQYLNVEKSEEEEHGEIEISRINISPDCTIDLRGLNESLMKRIEQNDYHDFCASIYKKRTNWGRTVPIEELASYQSHPLKKPLTNISPLLTPIAIKAFARLLKYAEIKKSKKDPRSYLLKMLEICFHEDQSVQDEVYMQIAKQLNKSEMPMRRKFYSAMAVFSSFISTSSRTIYPLLNYFYNNTLTEKDEMNKQYCKFIFTRLRKGFQSPRAYLPTRREIALIEKRKQLLIPIFVYGDRNVFIAVESYSDVTTALSQVIKELDIETNAKHYCLVEQIVTYSTETHKWHVEESILSDDEKIMDVISSWDLERDLINKKRSATNGNNISHASTAGGSASAAAHGEKHNQQEISPFQPKIIVKMRNFFRFSKFDIDSIFMYYAHSSCDFLNGRYILSEAIVLRLILFKLINDYGSSLSNTFFVQHKLDVQQYVPINLRTETFMATWQERVMQEFGKLKQLKSTWNQGRARTSFLNLLKKYSILFLSHQFQCHFYTAESSFSRASQNSSLNTLPASAGNFSVIEESIMAIKPFEILLLDADTMDIIETIRLADIAKFGKQAQNRLTIVKGDGKTFHLQVKDPDPYLQMINNYIKMAIDQSTRTS